MPKGRPGERGRRARLELVDDGYVAGTSPTQPATMEDWELDGGEETRDPRSYYVSAGRASDNVGQVRLSLRDKGLAEQIVAQRLIPEYRTVADFIRDAVHHRLLELTELGVMTGDLAARVTLAETEYRVGHMAEQQRAVQATMDQIRELFTLNRRNPTEMANLLASALDLAEVAADQQRAEILALANDMHAALTNH